jgi:1D-myo-inositol 3-kinase
MHTPESILIVGHYCHDVLVDRGGSEHRALGGSAAYVGAVLDCLGVPFRTVAYVGDDFLYDASAPRAARVVPGARTTAFVNDYRHGERVGTLTAACPPIPEEELNAERPAKIAICCAVAGEVLPAALGALRRRARVVLADAQGLVRSFGPGGEVGYRALSQTPFADALGALDYLKVGGAELPWVDVEALRSRLTLLVTDGERGCTLLGRSGSEHVVPFPAREVDATGAGDCFLAGFAAGLWRGLPPARAARLGNFCGARAVEAVGVPRLDRAAVEALALI